MIAVRMILSTIMPIIVSALMYLLNKKTRFRKLKYTKKQIIFGTVFGCIAILGIVSGVVKYSDEYENYFSEYNYTINARDAAPLCAGLIFGAPAGIIAGCIGGAARWIAALCGLGAETGIACSISTLLAGLIAAALRKFVYDNKRPPISHALIIGITVEIVHMLMILLTNINYVSMGFYIVQNIVGIMILCNSVSTAVAVFTVSMISKKHGIGKIKRKKGEAKQIIYILQKWLLIFIATAYLATTVFTFALQTNFLKDNTDTLLNLNASGVIDNINSALESEMLSTVSSAADDVANEDITNELLSELADKYNVSQVSYLNSDKIITASSVESYIGYDMSDLIYIYDDGTEYVQGYYNDEKAELDNLSLMGKFCGTALEDGGYLQIAYDSDKLQDKIFEYVDSFSQVMSYESNIVICDSNGNIAYDDSIMNMMDGITEALREIISEDPGKLITVNIEDVNYYGMYYNVTNYAIRGNTSGYNVVALISEEQALSYRNMTLYISTFMLTIIFSVLFFFIYVMIKKLVVRNIQKINYNLAKITSGDLNVSVNVRSSREFALLSDDINLTVAALKKYISDASARIDKELEVARTIQLSTLPVDFPKDAEKSGFEMYAKIKTAREVGGDFYDYYMIDPQRVAMVIADVSGKGISAAMFMMQAKSIIRSLTETETDAAKILIDANERLCQNNEAEMFVTIWLGILDIKTGVLTFANAGHNAPVILKNDGTCFFLKTRPGLVLAGMEGTKYKLNETKLENGDVICLYTDGITEAETTEHELYGNGRLLKCISEFKADSVKELCKTVKADVDRFVGNADQFDDMTLLALKYRAFSMRKKEFPAEKGELDNVIGFITSVTEPANVSTAVSNKVILSVEEIFINIASYAYPNGSGVTEISCGIFGGVIEVTFTDSGIPYNPLEKSDPDITLSAEERSIGGLGIYMVKKYMDDVIYSYKNGKNVLTLRKNLK